ncbi:coiled-coil domain-containing protein 166-like [Dendronephthya gigantea]|uniref:coiled-coil domain-containing protein 166-like n=1 Tax=Dendronephthya gigantea TaxID=151771 RepID=UPI001069B131|nr:coiled-coil domain-containing protein 166-like [Dendronephthya gigantea]
MPPKKKGKAKKGNANAEGDDDRADSKPTEREILLSQQLEAITEELKEVKRNVDELRKENEWLQEEAQNTRRESHEYMAYMSRKTQKRQSAIVSLNDNNQSELSKIQKQKEEMIAYYEELKNELKDQMLEKETELSTARKELTELEQYQHLQHDQEAEIKSLEDEVQQMRAKHSESIQKLKAQFLREKKQFQDQSDARIETMTKEANQEAKQSMITHTQCVKEENQKLRKELLALIRRTRGLHEKRQQLEEQHKTLKRDLQYGKDLSRIQGTRQNRLYKSFGIDEKTTYSNNINHRI